MIVRTLMPARRCFQVRLSSYSYLFVVLPFLRSMSALSSCMCWLIWLTFMLIDLSGLEIFSGTGGTTLS